MEKIPKQVLLDKNLSNTSVSLYVFMYNGNIYPPIYKRFAAVTQLQNTSIYQAKKLLEDLGYIKKDKFDYAITKVDSDIWNIPTGIIYNKNLPLSAKCLYALLFNEYKDKKLNETWVDLGKKINMKKPTVQAAVRYLICHEVISFQKKRTNRFNWDKEIEVLKIAS